jgi:Fe-S oxidoreductase
MGIDYVREYLPFLPHTATLIVMYGCVAVVIGLFVWGFVQRYGRYSRPGMGLWATIDGKALPWRPRLGRAVRDVVAQSKVRERRLPAALHLPLFYGVVLLFVGTVIVLVNEDILRWFGDFRIGGLFYVIFEATLDLAGLALVVGVGIALWRRLVARPDYLTRKTSTTLVLWGLLFMGLSGFLLEGYRIAAQPANEWASAAFVGSAVAGLLEGWARAEGGPVTFYQALWWTHAAAAFTLIVGVAWTGFSHLVLVPGNVAAHDPERPRTELSTPFNLIAAMESEEDVELVAGTAATGDIAPPGRLAADACVACGRCHAECPAVASGRPLSPRDLVQDIQQTLGTGLARRDGDRPALDFADAVWSCTNCYACEQACPARIRHVDYVLDFRRALIDQNKVDEQKLGVLQALDRNQNPYRLPSHERAAWVGELPYAEEVVFGLGERSGSPEYLFWVGCAAAYDERTSQVVRATMDLLRAAGVDFVTLGPAEPCCGEPAKRLGEEGRFQMIAMTAIETIKETGAARVVTCCPHGLNVFMHEYPALGFTIPAVHHTELLAELVASGRLQPADGAGANVVYHEPCNLVRAGRPSADALGLLDGAAMLAARSGVRTFCCGGGGGNSFYQVEQEERRISAIRYEELAGTGAARVAVSCPFCLTMLRDAAAAQGEHGLEVVDVAEIVADGAAATAGRPSDGPTEEGMPR